MSKWGLLSADSSIHSVSISWEQDRPWSWLYGIGTHSQWIKAQSALPKVRITNLAALSSLFPLTHPYPHPILLSFPALLLPRTPLLWVHVLTSYSVFTCLFVSHSLVLPHPMVERNSAPSTPISKLPVLPRANGLLLSHLHLPTL